MKEETGELFGSPDRFEMKYFEKYKINVHDVDYSEVISPTGLLRYMQDSANCQLEHDGLSYEELFDRGYAFIISRIRVNISEELHSHETVEASTWQSATHGATFERCYEVTRDGVTVAAARSNWALVDIATKRICRVSDIIEDYGRAEPLDIELPRRLAFPSKFEKVGEKTVSYSDIDKNMHMNNTRYGDMFYGAIPERPGRLAVMDIFYRSEAPLGEKLEILCKEGDGGYYLRSVRENGSINAEAFFGFEKK